MSEIFDDRACELGEGPLWHPERGQLFWFDIIGKRLMTRDADGPTQWDFDEHVSAAGWVDRDTLLIASETGLWRFGLPDGRRELVATLEADNPVTRSNDGRADPWGGFWIGTMAKQNANQGQGAIYRYFQGELRCLHSNISVSNAICFALDGGVAYYTDTPTQKIMRQPLEPDSGWPDGDPEVWLDLSKDGVFPDGAVVDAEGNFWNAQWGAWRVACYAPDGSLLRTVDFDAAHTSCPAFGGPGLTTLFCTTALQALSIDIRGKSDNHGMTFAARETAQGQEEHQVKL